MLLPWVYNWLKKSQQIGVNGCKVIEEVRSEVLQGSVLGMMKSGDVIKLIRKRKGCVEAEKAANQQMKFGVDKYTVAHTQGDTAPVLFCT